MRPNTLAEAVERIRTGSARDVELAEFVDTFDTAKTDHDRYASIEADGRWQAGCACRRNRRVFGKTASARPRSEVGVRSGATLVQSLVYNGVAVGCHA
jgi:hypothetical protein